MALPKRRKAMTESQVGENSKSDLRSDFAKNAVFVKDVKAHDTEGGTFTSGSYQTRVLNTLENPSSVSWISLNSNQFTLQAGTYEIEGSAPCYQVGNNRSRIRNITDGSTAIVGSVELAGLSSNTTIRSLVKGTITITAPKVFEFQHICGTTVSTNGFGSRLGLADAEVEVYAQLRIAKVGS